MRQQFGFAACAVLLAACGQARAAPSALQRFDALGPSLKQVTAGSAAVTSIARRIDITMRLDDAAGTRSHSRLLRESALQLERQASIEEKSIRALLTAGSSPTIQRYFRLIESALMHQRHEGQDLIAVTDVIRADPLLSRSGDGPRLVRTYARAREEAALAVQATHVAGRFRELHRAAFTYVPAQQASS